MATEIRVPTLGESVSEATIGKWFKKVGDAVAALDHLSRHRYSHDGVVDAISIRAQVRCVTQNLAAPTAHIKNAHSGANLRQRKGRIQPP